MMSQSLPRRQSSRAREPNRSTFEAPSSVTARSGETASGGEGGLVLSESGALQLRRRREHHAYTSSARARAPLAMASS